jgi:hypothetical protein
MIQTLECVKGDHIRCAKTWNGDPRHLCRCPCHDLLDEVLEHLSAEGIDIETCDLAVITQALEAALEAPVTNVT